MTLDDLKRHADKFGPEGVMEVAAERLVQDELHDLLRHLDGIEKRKNPWAGRRRLTVEERVERLLAA